MNKRAKKLYAIMYDNKILYINTTLKALHGQFMEAEKGSLSYITLFRKFHPEKNKEKDINYFDLNINGKIYYFQKVV